ncbi:MAG: sulfite exporter TauE/SafE family protein [Phycisphaerales bacterium]|nr:sulfite exporter TauE/SafE family protein [Phycisphaerales bacterium]
MEFVLIPLAAALVAALTLVSGFGLGTLLLPAFAVFFPLEIAIAATGVVHLVNNLFKLGLVARWASREVVLRFGIPAILAAMAGGACMTLITRIAPIHTYRVGTLEANITWLRLVIAALLAGFAALELWPAYQRLGLSRRALPVGGVLSGFFGGISGMQGALRAPFLLRAGLTREQFVGTTNVISTMVDVTRLLVYALGFAVITRARIDPLVETWRTPALIGAACLAGFLGSYVGARLITKVTLQAVRRIVAALLFLVAGAMGAGLV